MPLHAIQRDYSDLETMNEARIPQFCLGKYTYLDKYFLMKFTLFSIKAYVRNHSMDMECLPTYLKILLISRWIQMLPRILSSQTCLKCSKGNPVQYDEEILNCWLFALWYTYYSLLNGCGGCLVCFFVFLFPNHSSINNSTFLLLEADTASDFKHSFSRSCCSSM